MALRCAYCGSNDTQSCGDTYNCLNCGESTTAQGRQVPTEKRLLNDDEYTALKLKELEDVNEEIRRLKEEHNG